MYDISNTQTPSGARICLTLAAECDRVLEVVEHRDRRDDVELAPLRSRASSSLRREDVLDDRDVAGDLLGHVGRIDPELREAAVG